MFKENGYDEFLAECVRQGRAEIEQGLGYSPEEAKALAMQAIERKANEIAEFEQEVLRYA